MVVISVPSLRTAPPLSRFLEYSVRIGSACISLRRQISGILPTGARDLEAQFHERNFDAQRAALAAERLEAERLMQLHGGNLRGRNREHDVLDAVDRGGALQEGIHQLLPDARATRPLGDVEAPRTALVLRLQAALA